MRTLKSTLLKICCVIIICFLVQPAQAKYGGGTGEPNDPYLIYDANQMNEVGTDPNDWDKHFKLMADIEMEGRVYDMALIAPDLDNTNLIFDGWDFRGVFDGNGYKIMNFTIDTAGASNDYLGLFGMLANVCPCSPGEIYNLGVENIVIKGGNSSCFVGGLVGKICYGKIKNCYAEGMINSGNDSWGVGGVVGQNDQGTISNCYARCSVSSGANSIAVGGLVGDNFLATITNSYSCSNVSSGTASKGLGGLVGKTYPGLIVNCYSTGSISGGTGTSCIGGLVGGGGGVINSYWDVNSSGIFISAGGCGKTAEELKQATTYLGWNCCREVVWTIDQGNDFPHLYWEKQPGIKIPVFALSDFISGLGDPNDPYQIFTAEELNIVGKFPCEWNRHFCLMADVDLSDYRDNDFPVIGASPLLSFTGVFSGNGHVIRNLNYNYSEDMSYVGIFGCIGPSGVVQSLGAADVNVAGGINAWKLGCLAGENRGVVSNCFASGNIFGDNSGCLGGLVGVNTGTISNCYATSEVNGGNESWDIGGLVGAQYHGGMINASYATGKVSAGPGSYELGGLVGYNLGTTTASFWDIETSDCNTSDGGEGKTTVEMQTESTFTNAGWDFVGETANGTDDIWDICEGTNYPKLVWQIPVADFICPDGVNMLDFAVLGLAWMSEHNQGNWNPECDISDPNDDIINLLDLAVFTENWLTGI